MNVQEKIKYKREGVWYDGVVLEHAYWIRADAYWIKYTDLAGLERITIAYESEMASESGGVPCTCGILASGGGFHSNWCDRYIAGVKIN